MNRICGEYKTGYDEHLKQKLNVISPNFLYKNLPSKLFHASQMAFPNEALRNDCAGRSPFQLKLLTKYWCAMRLPYPKVALVPFWILLSFVSRCLCGSGFSTLLQIKIKDKNKLDVQDDIRLALKQFLPRILKRGCKLCHYYDFLFHI